MLKIIDTGNATRAAVATPGVNVASMLQAIPSQSIQTVCTILPPIELNSCVRMFDLLRNVVRRDGTAWIITPEEDGPGHGWEVAFALRDAGWYLRSEIIYEHPKARQGYFRIFLLAHPDSRGRYFYDQWAVREPASTHPSTVARNLRPDNNAVGAAGLFGTPQGQSGKGTTDRRKGNRNKRTVWHGQKALQTIIKAATPEVGVCPTCFAPYTRHRKAPGIWTSTCKCDHPVDQLDFPWVLDPWMGAGHVGRAALGLARNFIGFNAAPGADDRLIEHR